MHKERGLGEMKLFLEVNVSFLGRGGLDSLKKLPKYFNPQGNILLHGGKMDITIYLFIWAYYLM